MKKKIIEFAHNIMAPLYILGFIFSWFEMYKVGLVFVLLASFFFGVIMLFAPLPNGRGGLPPI